MSWLFGYLHLEILLRVILSWNNSKGKYNMFVIPVPFSKYHEDMLAHCKELLEDKNGQVAINPKFTKLITSLRTAVEKGEESLDKEMTSYDDCFDSFRLNMMFWHWATNIVHVTEKFKMIDTEESLCQPSFSLSHMSLVENEPLSQEELLE
jgi:hypothetical protein